jgi:hypothetical protein
MRLTGLLVLFLLFFFDREFMEAQAVLKSVLLIFELPEFSQSVEINNSPERLNKCK